MSDIPQKRCTGPCGRMLPATMEFFKRHKDCKYGVHSQCRECINKHNRERYHNEPEYCEHCLALNRASWSRNPERKRANAKVYWSRPEIRERHRVYEKARRMKHKAVPL